MTDEAPRRDAREPNTEHPFFLNPYSADMSAEQKARMLMRMLSECFTCHRHPRHRHRRQPLPRHRRLTAAATATRRVAAYRPHPQTATAAAEGVLPPAPDLATSHAASPSVSGGHRGQLGRVVGASGACLVRSANGSGA